MKLIKLTALFALFIVFATTITSCERNAEKKITTDFSKNDIPLTGANETPAVTSAALGSMDVFYTRETRILSYTVRWSGLTDSVLLMHIHGLAPTGFAAGVVQTIVGTSNTIFNQKTSGKFTFAKSGSLSGTLLVDGVAVKENDLLNGQYYMNIHTNSFPNGEIRGQIRFQ
jgi:hypothetical protein